MNEHASYAPTVLAWLQAAGVFLLGAIAAWIAYQQWRTAERKVQIDLFDKRFSVYDEARSVLRPVLQEGSASNKDFFGYISAIDKAPFLFGPEVVARLETTRQDLNRLCYYSSLMRGGPPYKTEAVDGQEKHLNRIADFFTDMPPLLMPYIEITQKPVSRWQHSTNAMKARFSSLRRRKIE